jgi:hypothetical protein
MGYWIKGTIEGLAHVKVHYDHRGKTKKEHAVKRGFYLGSLEYDSTQDGDDITFEIIEFCIPELNVLWPDPEQRYGDIEVQAELKDDYIHWSVQGSETLNVDFRMEDFEDKYTVWERSVDWEANADPIEFFRKYAVRIHDDFEDRCPSEIDTVFRLCTIQSFGTVGMKFTGVGEDGEKVEDNQ